MDEDQARMARAALKLSVRDLAAAAKVPPNAVTRVESGLPVDPKTAAAIRSALEAAGVQFIAENGGAIGLMLRKKTSAPGSISVEDLNASNDE
jgi:transcriptional regulator with XRE-family HTH domain